MSDERHVRQQVATDPDWYEPYAISQAIIAGDLIFVSGQAGIGEAGATVPGGFEAQARQAVANIERVLGVAGGSIADIVKVTIFVTDIKRIEDVIRLRRELFTRPYPADTIAQVAALAAPDWEIEIEAIARIASTT